MKGRAGGVVSWGVGGAFDMTKEKDPDSPRNPPAAARLPKWKRRTSAIKVHGRFKEKVHSNCKETKKSPCVKQLK